ncbi:hypothetical protein [Proteiniborus sp. MB09-C3]|uniref:hypothetical protein n=1 Tax=Proteiniborus sp. MB09-C3 TaxID=3050072 RepID=UPI002557A000|nr:hypothetical protein [Proteiniborus sp. MB09-C3]WIV12728.1 hypothetical protein QO263_03165 [Proteiniborus sp. MB09-C3]
MKINDNYLKEQLKHVYWLNGGACAGKTTMTKKFVNELGFKTLADDVLKYRSFSCPIEHSTLQMPNPNLDWNSWFNRPVEVYSQWLVDIAKEMMEFFVIDLLKMPNEQPIVVDLGIMPDVILPFIAKEKIICLYTSPEEIERLYFFRDDHKMILDCINAHTLNPEKTINHANKAIVSFSNSIMNACINSGIKAIERVPHMTKDEQFRLICEHFEI